MASSSSSSSSSLSSNRDYVYIKRITSLEIENEKLRRRLHFASNTISSAQEELVTFQKEQSEDTRKLQRTLIVVRKRYDDLKRNIIASRVRKVLLRVSFGSWKSQAIVPEIQFPESKVLEIQDELSETKRELTRLRIHKVLGSFEMRLQSSRKTKMRTFLHRWRYGSIEEKKVGRAFRVLTDVTYRTLREALKTWKSKANQITLILKVTKRIARAPMAASWNTWIKYVEEERERERENEISRAAESRNALAAELARTRRNLAMHSKISILTRLTQRKLRVPFETWRDKTLLLETKREEMGVALSRLLRLCDRTQANILREYFWIWFDNATHIRTAESRTRTIMRKAIKRYRNQNLSKAFQRWGQSMLHEREQNLLQRLQRSSKACALFALECGMSRMRFLQKSRGWRRWREFLWSERVGIVDQRVRKRRVQRMLSKWIANKKTKAFEKWRNVLVEKRHQEAVMKRFVKHVLNGALSRGFGKWFEFIQGMKCGESGSSKLLRCFARIANRKKFRAFATWYVARVKSPKTIFSLCIFSLSLSLFFFFSFLITTTNIHAGKIPYKTGKKMIVRESSIINSQFWKKDCLPRNKSKHFE